uniref:(northern house mosquito) hypothetical protein n=1 Tax=Culex pipiens TaxID=7175 RepID=A0A8D8G9I2_CULPI
MVEAAADDRTGIVAAATEAVATTSTTIAMEAATGTTRAVTKPEATRAAATTRAVMEVITTVAAASTVIAIGVATRATIVATTTAEMEATAGTIETAPTTRTVTMVVVDTSEAMVGPIGTTTMGGMKTVGGTSSAVVTMGTDRGDRRRRRLVRRVRVVTRWLRTIMAVAIGAHRVTITGLGTEADWRNKLLDAHPSLAGQLHHQQQQSGFSTGSLQQQRGRIHF